MNPPKFSREDKVVRLDGKGRVTGEDVWTVVEVHSDDPREGYYYTLRNDRSESSPNRREVNAEEHRLRLAAVGGGRKTVGSGRNGKSLSHARELEKIETASPPSDDVVSNANSNHSGSGGGGEEDVRSLTSSLASSATSAHRRKLAGAAARSKPSERERLIAVDGQVWFRVLDASTGCYYFANERSGEVKWETPENSFEIFGIFPGAASSDAPPRGEVDQEYASSPSPSRNNRRQMTSGKGGDEEEMANDDSFVTATAGETPWLKSARRQPPPVSSAYHDDDDAGVDNNNSFRNRLARGIEEDERERLGQRKSYQLSYLNQRTPPDFVAPSERANKTQEEEPVGETSDLMYHDASEDFHQPPQSLRKNRVSPSRREVVVDQREEEAQHRLQSIGETTTTRGTIEEVEVEEFHPDIGDRIQTSLDLRLALMRKCTTEDFRRHLVILGDNPPPSFTSFPRPMNLAGEYLDEEGAEETRGEIDHERVLMERLVARLARAVVRMKLRDISLLLRFILGPGNDVLIDSLMYSSGHEGKPTPSRDRFGNSQFPQRQILLHNLESQSGVSNGNEEEDVDLILRPLVAPESGGVKRLFTVPSTASSASCVSETVLYEDEEQQEDDDKFSKPPSRAPPSPRQRLVTPGKSIMNRTSSPSPHQRSVRFEQDDVSSPASRSSFRGRPAGPESGNHYNAAPTGPSDAIEDRAEDGKDDNNNSSPTSLSELNESLDALLQRVRSAGAEIEDNLKRGEAVDRPTATTTTTTTVEIEGRTSPPVSSRLSNRNNVNTNEQAFSASSSFKNKQSAPPTKPKATQPVPPMKPSASCCVIS